MARRPLGLHVELDGVRRRIELARRVVERHEGRDEGQRDLQVTHLWRGHDGGRRRARHRRSGAARDEREHDDRAERDAAADAGDDSPRRLTRKELRGVVVVAERVPRARRRRRDLREHLGDREAHLLGRRRP